MIQVPEIEDYHVKELIKVVCPGSKPIYVNVEPESFAEKKGCFPAVQQKIERDGGFCVLGWQIWKSEILIEAEFHAIWKSFDGKQLIDITPKEIKFSKILFLPDLKAKYVGNQVDNVRLNISGNRLVDDFIEISKAIFRIENKSERALQYEISLSDSESQIYRNLNRLKAGVYSMIQNGKMRNSLCFCGSRGKYKHCCGKYISKQLKRI